MKSFKILSALLLALRPSPSSLLPQATQLQQGAHVASHRYRTTHQFFLLYQTFLCSLELRSSRFTSACLLVLGQLMTKRQTQINILVQRRKFQQRILPSKTNRQTDGHQPCYRDTLLARRNYKASRLTPLACLITLSFRRPHTPMAKATRNVSTCDEWPLVMYKLLQSIPLSSRLGISFMSRKTFLIPEQPAGAAKATSAAVHPPSCSQGCI